MLKYVNSTLGFKAVLVILIYFMILHSISMIFGDMNVNGSILIIIFFIPGFFSDSKTKQINNIVLVLPLSRRKLWMAFYIRTFLFIFYVIAADIFFKLVLNNSRNILDEIFSNYITNSIILICLYNFNLLKNNYLHLGKSRSNIIAFSFSFSSIFLSILILIMLSVFNYDIRNAGFNSLSINEISVLLLILLNIVFPVALSYFATLKSKSLLNFRIA